jgi:hypothetical protein
MSAPEPLRGIDSEDSHAIKEPFKHKNAIFIRFGREDVVLESLSSSEAFDLALEKKDVVCVVPIQPLTSTERPKSRRSTHRSFFSPR